MLRKNWSKIREAMKSKGAELVENHSQDDDPFAFNEDGTPWPDAEFNGPLSPSRKGDPIKLGSTANPKKKPADLEGKTRELLRSMGYVYGKTEQYNSYTAQRKDLFGCVDGIAVKANEVLFVQTCTRSAFAPHVGKMAKGEFKIGNGTPFDSFEATQHLVQMGQVKLVIVLWDQPGGEGTKWVHEVRTITLQDLLDSKARARKK